MRFHGDPGDPHRASVSRSRRRHLPDTVEPGVEYQDVRVDYRLASRLGGVDMARFAAREARQRDLGEADGEAEPCGPEPERPAPESDDD